MRTPDDTGSPDDGGEVAPTAPTDPEARPGRAEPEMAEAAPEPEPVASPPGGGRRRLLVSAAATVLLVLSAVLVIGLVRTRDELADRKQATAALEAERDHLRTDLDAATARRHQLERDLAAAQANAIDPAHLELIKKCVQMHAQAERALRDAAASGAQISPPGTGPNSFVKRKPDGSFTVDTTCADAEPYLK